MSKFKNTVLHADKEAEKTRKYNMLNEDIWSFIRVVFFSGVILLSNIHEVNAKTNYEALHINHDVIAKYESGDKGYEAIAKDNYSGHSYGKWQISTYRKNGKSSTFDYFLKYAKENDVELYNILEKAGGYKAAYRGDKLFIKVWLNLASNKKFQNLYDNFILNTQIVPVYRRLDDTHDARLDRVTTWGSSNDAVQAAIKSIIIQHGCGGAYRMINTVMDTHNPKTEEDFLNRLYSLRISKFPLYVGRYKAEHKELKQILIAHKQNNKII